MELKNLYALYQKTLFIQTDTRKLKVGDLFFALKGENFNGNLFAKQALEKGASAVILDEKPEFEDSRIILVEDVLITLQLLAKLHRQQFNIPFLAITGSNGKTTTKELIHAVLSSHFITSTTEGNLNNHIGIPLTLLKIPTDTEIAIIEMGANHQKEIDGYCTYVLPTHGIINNVGKAHLEGFGGIEGVKKGKGELYDFIRQNNGTIFINTDYDYLLEMSNGITKRITYGKNDAEIRGKIIDSEPFLKVEIINIPEIGFIQTQLVGDYNFQNLLAAVAAGKHFGVPAEKIKTAIENYTPSNSRSQLFQKGTNQIILDAYNANPSSMKLAIENFARFHAETKILMLGAMAELGKESLEEHKQIIELIQSYKWAHVVLVGGDFLKINHFYLSFSTSEEAKQWFKNQNFEKTFLLIKGSRSIKMEKIIE